MRIEDLDDSDKVNLLPLTNIEAKVLCRYFGKYNGKQWSTRYLCTK